MFDLIEDSVLGCPSLARLGQWYKIKTKHRIIAKKKLVRPGCITGKQESDRINFLNLLNHELVLDRVSQDQHQHGSRTLHFIYCSKDLKKNG